MQPGPAVSTRARSALGDISNRGLAGPTAGKAGGKVRRPPVPAHPAPGDQKLRAPHPQAGFKPEAKLAGRPAPSVKPYGSEANQEDAQVDAPDQAVGCTSRV